LASEANRRILVTSHYECIKKSEKVFCNQVFSKYFIYYFAYLIGPVAHLLHVQDCYWKMQQILLCTESEIVFFSFILLTIPLPALIPKAGSRHFRLLELFFFHNN
jgi:hypothetical protein